MWNQSSHKPLYVIFSSQIEFPIGTIGAPGWVTFSLQKLLRTYRELHANASCIAHNLLLNQKPLFKPGDRVLLAYIPGLDFIDPFFGCLRAELLPAPILPLDPLQRGRQALLKIENVTKSCNALAVLSTIWYHVAVCAGSVKSFDLIYKKK